MRGCKLRGMGLLLLLMALGLQGCGPRYRPVRMLGWGMEASAKERYGQGLRSMEASRFELAEEQFAIAEKTAVSPELQALAREGRGKAAAAIEAKR